MKKLLLCLLPLICLSSFAVEGGDVVGEGCNGGTGARALTEPQVKVVSDLNKTLGDQACVEMAYSKINSDLYDILMQQSTLFCVQDENQSSCKDNKLNTQDDNFVVNFENFIKSSIFPVEGTYTFYNLDFSGSIDFRGSEGDLSRLINELRCMNNSVIALEEIINDKERSEDERLAAIEMLLKKLPASKRTTAVIDKILSDEEINESFKLKVAQRAALLGHGDVLRQLSTYINREKLTTEPLSQVIFLTVISRDPKTLNTAIAGIYDSIKESTDINEIQKSLAQRVGSMLGNIFTTAGRAVERATSPYPDCSKVDNKAFSEAMAYKIHNTLNSDFPTIKLAPDVPAAQYALDSGMLMVSSGAGGLGLGLNVDTEIAQKLALTTSPSPTGIGSESDYVSLLTKLNLNADQVPQFHAYWCRAIKITKMIDEVDGYDQDQIAEAINFLNTNENAWDSMVLLQKLAKKSDKENFNKILNIMDVLQLKHPALKEPIAADMFTLVNERGIKAEKLKLLELVKRNGSDLAALEIAVMFRDNTDEDIRSAALKAILGNSRYGRLGQDSPILGIIKELPDVERIKYAKMFTNLLLESLNKPGGWQVGQGGTQQAQGEDTIAGRTVNSFREQLALLAVVKSKPAQPEDSIIPGGNNPGINNPDVDTTQQTAHAGHSDHSNDDSLLGSHNSGHVGGLNPPAVVTDNDEDRSSSSGAQTTVTTTEPPKERPVLTAGTQVIRTSGDDSQRDTDNDNSYEVDVDYGSSGRRKASSGTIIARGDVPVERMNNDRQEGNTQTYVPEVTTEVDSAPEDTPAVVENTSDDVTPSDLEERTPVPFDGNRFASANVTRNPTPVNRVSDRQQSGNSNNTVAGNLNQNDQGNQAIRQFDRKQPRNVVDNGNINETESPVATNKSSNDLNKDLNKLKEEASALRAELAAQNGPATRNLASDSDSGRISTNGVNRKDKEQETPGAGSKAINNGNIPASSGSVSLSSKENEEYSSGVVDLVEDEIVAKYSNVVISNLNAPDKEKMMKLFNYPGQMSCDDAEFVDGMFKKFAHKVVRGKKNMVLVKMKGNTFKLVHPGESYLSGMLSNRCQKEEKGTRSVASEKPNPAREKKRAGMLNKLFEKVRNFFNN